MIKRCIFDMGGVIVRDFHIWPELSVYLGFTEKDLHKDVYLHEALHRHSLGEISENEFWSSYRKSTGITALPPGIPIGANEADSLLGKFFHPRIDEPTAEIVKQLKASGMRVVIGTNVIDSHYTIHNNLHQYDLFDKVYASHLMGIAKPDPAFFSYILNAEGIRAEEAFFTDDFIENVNTAAEAGLNAFLYTDASALKEQLHSFGLPGN